VTWNILHGQSIPPGPHTAKESAGQLQSAASILRDCGVEVLALQEVDRNQDRSGAIDQIMVMARECGAEHWAFAPTLIGTPGEKWRSLTHDDTFVVTEGSVRESINDQPQYGIGLISKIPVTAWHRLELGRSRVGLPLLFPATDPESKRKFTFIYVKDEPRVALAAQLENGFTVVVTHLSFVPLVNLYQLRKIRRWLKRIPGTHLIVGDLNLGWGIPVRGTQWRSLVESKTYPSWEAKIQFDYITAHLPTFGERIVEPLEIPSLGISDHLPIGVAIS